jgi:hypothetical protein
MSNKHWSNQLCQKCLRTYKRSYERIDKPLFALLHIWYVAQCVRSCFSVNEDANWFQREGFLGELVCNFLCMDDCLCSCIARCIQLPAQSKSSYRLWSSWCATTCLYSCWNERLLQLTKIVFRMYMCQHWVGMWCGGSSATSDKVPRQSELICTNPFRPGTTMFTASSTRWIAISPISSPQYAFAAAEAFVNAPTIWSQPFKHSRMKASKQSSGQYSLM